MKLRATWMNHEGTKALMTALSEAGHQAYFVGGCVRNGLIDAPVEDIDIATDARPEAVIALSEAAGLKPIPTGIDHGTITVVADGKPLEVTTFRKDLETDGRRATVGFSTRIEDDAARRDFTMNSLYAAQDGTVLDPTGEGLGDLHARRVRFIGAPEDRIREDYLRILRFFRFHAWYAVPENGLDADSLAACASLSGGLETLSRERIGAEIKKLLSAPNPSRAVAAMEQSGVLAQVLPGTTVRALMVLIAEESRIGAAPDPIRRLAALGGPAPDDLLRLSRVEAKTRALLTSEMAATTGPGELGYRHGAQSARDILLLRAAALEQLVDPSALAAAEAGAAAEFPVTAADLMPDLSGPALGEKLAELEARWIASDFTLDKAALLA